MIRKVVYLPDIETAISHFGLRVVELFYVYIVNDCVHFDVDPLSKKLSRTWVGFAWVRAPYEGTLFGSGRGGTPRCRAPMKSG